MNKQEAANRISLFLEMSFFLADTMNITVGTTNTGGICIIDNETSLSKTFKPHELNELYENWSKSRKKD